jgi:hypothetical protein
MAFLRYLNMTSLTTFQFFKSLLGTRPVRKKLKCEELECAKTYVMLCAASYEGRLLGVFGHVPNESGQHTGLAVARSQALKGAMGMIPGFPDYVFMMDGKGWLVEMKFGDNNLTERQELVRQWCKRSNVPHYVCYSCKEVETLLIELGVLLPN